MSKWFEIPVIRSMIILVGAFVAGASIALAQDDAKSQGAETKEPAAERKRVMISTGLDSTAIATRWPDDAVWLEMPEEGRVLALFTPEADTPAKGALLILADEGRSAASGLAGALRQPMARAGWAVMTLGLKPPPYVLQQAYSQRAISGTYAPAGGTTNDNGEGADDVGSVMIDVMDSVDVDEMEDEYRTRIQKSLTVAVGNLVDRGYERVAVAGVGLAAGHVARMAIAESRDVSALIWLAPVFDRVDSAALPEWLSEAGQVRVLELHSSRVPEVSDGAGLMSPKQREAAFRRAEIAAYTRQPVAMAERPASRDAAALANRLSSWLASDQ